MSAPVIGAEVGSHALRASPTARSDSPATAAPGQRLAAHIRLAIETALCAGERIAVIAMAHGVGRKAVWKIREDLKRLGQLGTRRDDAPRECDPDAIDPLVVRAACAAHLQDLAAWHDTWPDAVVPRPLRFAGIVPGQSSGSGSPAQLCAEA